MGVELMAERMIFETDDQRESHEKLIEVQKKHPLAECRVDLNREKPFQVWTAPDARTRVGDPVSDETVND